MLASCQLPLLVQPSQHAAEHCLDAAAMLLPHACLLTPTISLRRAWHAGVMLLAAASTAKDVCSAMWTTMKRKA